MEQSFRRILEGGGGLPGRALRAALAPAALAYAHMMRRRRQAYADGRKTPCRAPVPVISVGNLAAGGAGKTPFAILVCETLRDLGRAPGFLCRGYRAENPDDADELELVRRRLPGIPAIANPDRVAGALSLAESGADVVVLDDGFQHLRLARDLDIVLIDAACPWAGGRAFPAGLLREPKDALRAASVVVATRSDQASPETLERIRAEVDTIRPGVPFLLARHEPTGLFRLSGEEVPLSELSGMRVVAAAGIARPEAFHRTLEGLGATVARAVSFPDHHAYAAKDVQVARFAAAVCAATVVTTEKDSAKMAAVADEDGRRAILALRVAMRVDKPEILRDLLAAAVSASADWTQASS